MLFKCIIFLNVIMVSTTGAIVAQTPVSLPTLNGSPGDQIVMEINTGDITGQNVVGYNFRFTYDPAVLSITGVDRAGTTSAGFGAPTTNNNTDSGVYSLAAASINPVDGEGVFIKILAEIVGEGTSPLTWVRSDLSTYDPGTGDEGALQVQATNGEVVSEAPNLSIGFDNMSVTVGENFRVPVKGVDMKAGDAITSIELDLSYDPAILDLTSVMDGELLQGTGAQLASEFGEPGSLRVSITSGSPIVGTGALFYLQGAVKSAGPTGLTVVNASVNGGATLTGITDGQVTSEDRSVSFTLADAEVLSGEAFSVPISVDRIEAGDDVRSIQLSLSYDDQILDLTGVAKGTLLDSPDITVQDNASEGGRGGSLDITISSTSSILGEGTLLRLVGTVLAEGNTDLRMDQVTVNDGYPLSQVNNGTVTSVEPNLNPGLRLPTLSVNPLAGGEAGPFEQVALDIYLDDISEESLVGYNFAFTYNPDVLRIQNVATSGFGASVFNDPVVNSGVPGEFNLSAAASSQVSIAGAGTFIRINAEVIGTGESALVWNTSELLREDDSMVAIRTVDGNVSSRAVQVGVGDLDGTVSRTYQVPVTIAGIGDKAVSSYSFDLGFDPALVRVNGIQTEGTLSSAMTVTRTGATVSATGGAGVSEAGTLLILDVEVLSTGTNQLNLGNAVFRNSDAAAVQVAVEPGGLTLVVNSAPLFTTQAEDVTVTSAQTYTTTFGTSDVNNDAVTLSLLSDVAGASIDSQTGVFIWTPTQAQVGEVTHTVSASDGLDSTQVSFVTTVLNDVPAFTQALANTAAAPRSELRFTYVAADAGGNPIDYRIVSGPDGALIDSETGVLTWTPGLDQLGASEIVVGATDGLDEVETSATVTVAFDDIQFTRVLPDTVFSIGATLTFTYQAGVGAGRTAQYFYDGSLNGVVLDSETGALSWTPSVEQIGENTLEIRATDGIDTVSTSAVVTVLSTGLAFVSELSDTTLTSSETLRFTFQAENETGTDITYSLQEAVAGVTFDAATGAFEWTPAQSQVGSTTFTVSATDQLEVVKTSFTVSVLNDVPAFNKVLADTTLYFGDSFSFTYEASDLGGNPIEYLYDGSLNGVVLDSETGALSWTPSVEQIGENTLEIRATDGIDTVSTSAVVTVLSTGLAFVSELSDTTLTSSETLRFTFQAENETGTDITYSLQEAVAGVTFDAATGAFEWTPAQSQVGSTTFTVSATDQLEVVKTSFTVSVLNDVPAFNKVLADTTLYFGDSLSFTYAASDLGGNPIEYLYKGSLNGVVLDSETGALSWTPSEEQLGENTLEISATDGIDTVSTSAVASVVFSTARIQLIHNSADTSLSSVDVYANGQALSSRFMFREATPFLDFRTDAALNVAIYSAGADTAMAEPALSLPSYQLDRNGRYVIIVNGVMDESYSPNPDGISTELALFDFDDAQESSGSETDVAVYAWHGSTDAPEIDIYGRNSGILVSAISYGERTPYLTLPAAKYALDITAAGQSNVLISYGIDLSSLGGSSVGILASGFLDTEANNGGASFGLLAVLPDGTTQMLNTADQSVADVTFSVYMDIEEEFSSLSHDLHIYGSFVESGSWESPGASAATRLSPVGRNNKLFRITYSVPIGDHAFKFYFVPKGSNSSATYEWSGEPSRTLAVRGDTTVASLFGLKPGRFIDLQTVRGIQTGAPVRVSGTVTSPDFGTSSAKFYMQDGAGGIKVSHPSIGGFDNNTPFAASQSLIVDGRLGISDEETILNIDKYELLGEGAGLPDAIPLPAFTDWTVDSRYQGMRVVLTSMTLPESSGWPTEDITSGTGFTTQVEGTLPKLIGNYTVEILRNVSQLDGSARPTGTFNISGVMGRNQSTPVLRPFSFNDIGLATSVEGMDDLPAEHELMQNYPNPFNPSTQIRFALASTQQVKLEVFSVTGQRVAVLEQGVLPAGVHDVTFNADHLSSGLYMYRLTTPEFTKTRTMLLVK